MQESADRQALVERLRDCETLHARLTGALDQAFCTIDVVFDDQQRPVDYRFVEVNPTFAGQTGLVDAVGRSMRELRPDHEDFWFDIYGEIALTGEPRRFEHEAAALGRWFSVHAFRIGRPEQRRVAILFEDITTRRSTQAALRASEERFRRIVGNARDYAIFLIDPAGTITDWFPGAEAVFGWSAEEAIGQAFHMTFTQGDRVAGAPETEMEAARMRGLAPDIRWHRRKDERLVFIDGTVTPLTDANGSLSGFLKIGQDVTERHAAEERQRLLLAELQHRVRNTLAVVRAIARRTAQNSSSVEEMGAHLEGRLDAFARVQAMVTRTPQGGVDLASLIEDELLVHATREGEHLALDGPDVMLAARPAETLSLAIHELTTNAVKYGALGQESGKVAVRWSVSGGRLELVWEESDLPGPLAPPEREGFGLELLRRVVPYELGAETTLDFRPEGLLFRLSMPTEANVVGR